MKILFIAFIIMITMIITLVLKNNNTNRVESESSNVTSGIYKPENAKQIIDVFERRNVNINDLDLTIQFPEIDYGHELSRLTEKEYFSKVYDLVDNQPNSKNGFWSGHPIEVNEIIDHGNKKYVFAGTNGRHRLTALREYKEKYQDANFLVPVDVFHKYVY